MVYPDDEGSMILQNNGNNLPKKHNINILEDKDLQYLSATYVTNSLPYFIVIISFLYLHTYHSLSHQFHLCSRKFHHIVV